MAAGGKSSRSEGAGTGGDAHDYGAIYAAARESNARLRYWIYSIYGLHCMAPPPLYRAPHGPATHDYEPWQLRLLLSTKFLVLELSAFQTIHGYYTSIKGALPVRKKGGLDMIIRGHRVHGRLKSLRDGLAHSGMSLGELAREINLLGLDAYVHYARAALMFEDAVFETILDKQHRSEMDRQLPRFPDFGLPCVVDREAFAEKYSQVNFALDTECHQHDYAIMGELNHSLRMLSRGFSKAAGSISDDPPYGRHRFSDHLYHVKHMILDIHCFIAKFRKLGLDGSVEPAFAARESLYEMLRHDYSAHTKIKKIRGVEAMLEAHPSLLDDMLLDAVEIDALASRLLERVDAPPTAEISPMSAEQGAEVEKRLWGAQVGSHKFYGFDHVESYGGSTGREARERARRDLG